MKFAVVVWFDATSKYETREDELKEEGEIALGRCVSSGFVLKEDEELISLCQSVFQAPRKRTDLVLYRHVQTIPKAWVEQPIEYLKIKTKIRVDEKE